MVILILFRSDNGPQYTAQTFKRCSETWEFQHLTSSPGYSQSNGKAESAVKNGIFFIRRADMAKSDIFLAILGRHSSLIAAQQRQAHYYN